MTTESCEHAVGLQDVVKSYTRSDGDVHALAGITVAFEPGVATAITGTSGSGKSTLLFIVGGLDRPTRSRHQQLRRRIRVRTPLIPRR